MITLNKIIYDIKNIANSGVSTDDFRISDRQIEYWIHQCRSMLISQALDKNKAINDIWIQPLYCFELVQTDKSECCDIDLNCYILKSKYPLPQTIEYKDNNMIVSVTGLDDSPITETNQFRYKYKKYSKWTGKNKGWYIKNNYLYIINDQLLERVNIYGVFDDPTELKQFKSCSGDPCYTNDSKYPVSLKMASLITDIVTQTKVLPLLQIPQDTKNDANNEIIK